MQTSVHFVSVKLRKPLYNGQLTSSLPSLGVICHKSIKNKEISDIQALRNLNMNAVVRLNLSLQLLNYRISMSSLSPFPRKWHIIQSALCVCQLLEPLRLPWALY